MISFRAADGATFNKLDDAIEYETKRFKSSLDKRRRGRGSPEVFDAIKENLGNLHRYKRNGFVPIAV